MKIKVKRLSENAKLPHKAHSTDAGFDLYSVEDGVIVHGQRQLVKTDIAMEIPEGYCGIIQDRSGLAYKSGLTTMAGIIDSDYRDGIGIILFNTAETNYHYTVGERLAQILIVPVPEVNLEEVDELSDTKRGTGKFGSTGKK